RAKAQRMIDAGLVTVDGRPRPKSHALVGGETVEALSEPAPDPADPAAGEGVPFEVVYEDDHLIVVDRPAGVEDHPAARHADAPRAARTHFELEEELPRTSLLSVRLETGRTHQIRAHMAAIGHPVVGDSAYGGGKSGERLGLTRQFLHSRYLRFRHPVTGALI